MHALLSWVRSSLRRRDRPWVSVGLDLGPEFASWVILSGSQACAAFVVRAERLALPEGLVEAGRITQPTDLGHWLGQAVQELGCAVDVLSIGIDDTWITSHRLSLAKGLTQDDVSFQLLADVHSALAEGADVRIDYCLEPLQASTSELAYQVQSVPRVWVTDAQQLARAARLNLVSLMSRAQAGGLAQKHESLGSASTAMGPLVADHAVALGLALSAWGDVEFNLLPHRETMQRTARRMWQREALAGCVGGACLAAGFAVTLNGMTETLQAKLPPSEREAATRAHDTAKQAHDQLNAMAQRANAQANWLLGQQGLQASTLTWHRQLGQAAPGVWVSHVSQKGGQWSVQGEALSSHHAQQWVRRLGELDIWAKPPQLPALQLTQAVSQQGVPVWQFQVDAELKGVR